MPDYLNVSALMPLVMIIVGMGSLVGKQQVSVFMKNQIYKQSSNLFVKKLERMPFLVSTASQWALRRQFYMQVHLKMKQIFTLLIAHSQISANKFYTYYDAKLLFVRRWY